MKINETTIAMIEADFAAGDHGNTVFLAGDPGIGKTSILKALAKRWGSQAFVVSVNQMADKADLTGARLVKSDDGTTMEQRFFAHHRIRKAVDFAKANPHLKTLLILDEINRSTPDVTSGALSVSTERELGDSVLPDNLYIGVTGNIRGNVTAMDSASLSRFVIYEVEADAKTLIDYLDSRDGGKRPMNVWCKKVLMAHPNTVYQVSQPQAYTIVDGEDDDMDSVSAGFADLMDAGEEMLQLTTPRTIEGLSDWLDTITKQNTDNSVLMELFQTPVEIGTRETTQLNEVIEAHVGNTDFCTYLVQTISEDIVNTTASTQVNPGLTVAKPNNWAAVENATTVSELDNMIGKMNNTERSEMLTYALYSDSENAIIINQLLSQMNEIDENSFRLLGQLFANGRINDANRDVVTAISNNPVADRITSMANIFA